MSKIKVGDRVKVLSQTGVYSYAEGFPRFAGVADVENMFQSGTYPDLNQKYIVLAKKREPSRVSEPDSFAVLRAIEEDRVFVVDVKFLEVVSAPINVLDCFRHVLSNWAKEISVLKGISIEEARRQLYHDPDIIAIRQNLEEL